jgi:hypothetical protein
MDGDSDDSSFEEWAALVRMSELLGDGAADSLLASGPPPEVGAGARIARAPMIIDTDVGGDPDDTVALVVAARRVPELALVITSDEYGGERARFARHVLDLAGRPDVKVVAGSDLGNDQLYFVDGLFPAGTPRQDTDIVSAVVELCEAAQGPIRWVGMGPLSNLAALHAAQPLLIPRFEVTQMGGAIEPRDPAVAEHNFRMDPDAVIRMLPELELWSPSLVVSDVTITPALEITAESPMYRRWAEPDAPEWAKVLRAHHDRWLEHYPGSTQHAGLTLAAATLWPGMMFGLEQVVLDELARMRRSADGVKVWMSDYVDYQAFMAWVEAGLAW